MMKYKKIMTWTIVLMLLAGVFFGFAKQDASAAVYAAPNLSVTKISKNKVGMRWSAVANAAGYKIFKGNKLIKTVGPAQTTLLYKNKGAGSAKYKVAALIQTAGMANPVQGPFSKAQKGKKNERHYVHSIKVNTVTYGYAPFRVKKISLSGNTYTITGHCVNNRLFKMKKYKVLDLTVYCDGKVTAHKKFKNLTVNCKAYGAKKITVKIKGKGGVDFRNAQGKTLHWAVQPYWEFVGNKSVK